MNVFSLFADLTLDDKDFNRGLDRADDRLSRFQGNVERFGRRVQNIGATLSTRLTAPIVAAGGAALVAADRFSNMADAVDKGSQSAGLSAERYQTLRFAFDQSGISADQFDQSLNSLNRRLGLAAQGNASYADTYERLGVSIRDANGELRSTDEVFDDLIVALADIPSAAEQAATASTLFGDDVGKKLVPVLAQGADGLADLEQKARDAGIVMSGDAISGLVEYKDEMAAARESFQTAGVEITAAALPAFMGFTTFLRETAVPWVQNLAERLSGLFEWFAELSEGTQKFIGIAVAGLAATGPVVAAVGATTRAVSGLIGVVRTLRTLMLLASGPVGWITLLASAVGVGLVTAWNKNREAMNEAVEKTTEVRDALDGANDKNSLRAVVQNISKDLDEEARPEFVAYAEQALATATDIEEAARRIGRAWAEAANARELAQIEQRITRLTEERALLLENQEETERQRRNGLQDAVDNAQAWLGQLEREADEYLERTGSDALSMGLTRQLADAERDLAAAQQALANASVHAGEEVRHTKAGVDELTESIREAEAQKEALIEGSTFEIAGSANIETTVIPDPENSDADEEDPTGLNKLGGEPINVEVRVTRTGDDPIGLPTEDPVVSWDSAAQRRLDRIDANRTTHYRWGAEGRAAYTENARRIRNLQGGRSLPVPTPATQTPVTLDVPDARAFGEGVGLGITPILEVLSDPFAVERRDAFTLRQSRYGDGAAASANARRQALAMGAGVDMSVTPELDVGALEEYDQAAEDARAEMDALYDQIAVMSGDAPSQFDKMRDAVREFGEASDATDEEIAAMLAKIDELEQSDKLVNTLTDVSSVLAEIGGAAGGRLGEMLTGMSQLVDVGKQIASGDALGAVTSIVTDLVAGFTAASEAARDLEDDLAAVDARFGLISTENLVKTSREQVGSVLFGLIPVYGEVFDEAASEFGLSLAASIEEGMMGGLRKGMEAYLESGNIEDLEDGIEGGLRTAVTNALFESLINEAIIAGALGPLLTELTEAFAAGDRERANQIAHDINAMIPGLAQDMADIAAEMDYLTPTEDDPSGDAGGATGDGGDRSLPDQSFGSTPQGVQLAVAVPLVDAAEIIRDNIARLLDAGGPLDALAGMNPNAMGDFTEALRDATPVLDRLADGIDVRVGSGGQAPRGSRTAWIRGA